MRNLPAGGPMVVLPSPQAPLPRGQGLCSVQREVALMSLGCGYHAAPAADEDRPGERHSRVDAGTARPPLRRTGPRDVPPRGAAGLSRARAALGAPVRGRAEQPDVPPRGGRPGLRAAQAAARRAPSLRPRGGPGVPGHEGPRADRRPGPADAPPVRRPERHRHQVLRDGEGGRPRPCEPSHAGSVAGRAHGGLPPPRRRARGAARGLAGGGGARHLRPPRQLLRTADLALEQAVRRVPHRGHPRDGRAHGMAAPAHPRRDRDGGGARRLPARQRHRASPRAPHGRGPRLGALDPRPSPRRSRLRLPDLLRGRGRPARAQPAQPSRARHPDRGGVRRPLLRAGGSRRHRELALLSRLQPVPKRRDHPGGVQAWPRRQRELRHRPRLRGLLPGAGGAGMAARERGRSRFETDIRAGGRA